MNHPFQMQQLLWVRGYQMYLNHERVLCNLRGESHSESRTRGMRTRDYPYLRGATWKFRGCGEVLRQEGHLSPFQTGAFREVVNYARIRRVQMGEG